MNDERRHGDRRPIDTAPRDSTRFLGFDGAAEQWIVCCVFGQDDHFSVSWTGERVDSLTCWHPLPASRHDYSPSSKEGTDWAWCFENPREAASEIDRLNEEIQCLYGTIEAFERAADEPPALLEDAHGLICGVVGWLNRQVIRDAELRAVHAGLRQWLLTYADNEPTGRAAVPPSASHPVCIYRGGCQRPDCTDLCLGFRREAEPPYDHGLALNAQQITISLRQRCKCLEGYRGCVMCVAATFIERASAPGASETKPATTPAKWTDYESVGSCGCFGSVKEGSGHSVPEFCVHGQKVRQKSVRLPDETKGALAEQIAASQRRIEKWPADVKAAMGVEDETAPPSDFCVTHQVWTTRSCPLCKDAVSENASNV